MHACVLHLGGASQRPCGYASRSPAFAQHQVKHTMHLVGEAIEHEPGDPRIRCIAGPCGIHCWCVLRTCSIAGVTTLAMSESAGCSASLCASVPAGDAGLRRHAAYMP